MARSRIAFRHNVFLVSAPSFGACGGPGCPEDDGRTGKDRAMRAGVIGGAAGVLLALSGWSGTEAQAPSACRSDGLGVARTISLDSTQGPRYGNQQFHDHSLLRDGEVILTFDDGPHPLYTKMVLDALEAHCTRATFFMVGFRAMSAPAMVRDIARRGHTIGTHTWSHQDLA